MNVTPGLNYVPDSKSTKATPVKENPTSDNQDVNQGAAKFDAGKVRIDLVPYEFTFATAAGLTYGAIKYDEWNWAKGLRKGRIMAAMLRHAGAYMMGQELDQESGLPHTWHMAACLAMLIASDARGTAVEDRQFATTAMDHVENQFRYMKNPAPTVETIKPQVGDPL